MSLINEALKRAKQAQSTTPPPPNLEFRTVDRAAEQQQRNQKLMLALMMGVVVLLATLLIWQMVSPGGSRQLAHDPEKRLVVATSPARGPAPAPVAAPEPKAVAPRPAEPEPVTAASQPLKAAASEPVEPAVTPVPAPAAEVVPPKPPPKLQSIVFNPQRPSAMISGKIVHIGDKFGEWRITGIDQESATLVGSGVTNVLVLQQ